MIHALDVLKDPESARDAETSRTRDLDEALEIRRRDGGRGGADPVESLLQSLASDLHDGAVQELFAAELDAAELVASQELDPTTAAVAFRLYRRIHDTSRHLRAVMYHLSLGERPGLAEVAFEDALDECVDSFARRHSFTVDVDICGPEVEIGLAQRETAVRLVREGLANIGKHADATQVLVSVYRSDQWFTVDLDDDGHGDPVRIRCAIASNSGDAFGLHSLAAQAAIAGGRMWVSSAPKLGGVRISLALPSHPG